MFLLKIRHKALARRTWWRVLDGLERNILSVAARVIHEVKSSLLNQQLSVIIAKLNDASLGRLAKRIRDFGEQRAREISSIGKRFGSKVAIQWVDENFARYLAFMSLNGQSVLGL